MAVQRMALDDLIERVSSHIAAVIGRPPLPRVALAPAAAQQAAAPLAPYLDHTLLKPDATPAQVEQLCHEAQQHRFASVCVNPGYVAHCVQVLAGSNIPICTVAGFPLGATTTEVKVFEAQQAIGTGAHEIDMVLAIGLLKAGSHALVLDDIAQVVAACRAGGALCKVILETVLLTDEEKIAACVLTRYAGADFVKTSTGFAASGATVEDVALMRQVVGTALGVKASGGIRTAAAARAMLAAGASRIGTSSSVELVHHDAASGAYGL